MEKKIQIKITEDGKIFAETKGIKGKECLSFISILEELLEAETVDSNFTEEYYETEIAAKAKDELHIKGENTRGANNE